MPEPRPSATTALTPLELLWEAADLPSYRLAPELAGWYGGDFGLPRPVVYANFVTSLDGVAVVGPSSGSRLSGRSQADRMVMGLLRACADAIVIGSGTLAGSPGHVWTAEHIFPPAAAAFRQLRQSLGLGERPALVVVSGTGEVDLDHPGLARPGVILTSAAGRLRLGEGTAHRVLDLGRQRELDPVRVIEAVRELGNGAILTEGGPRLLGSLILARQLDQLFLTLSPLVAGRTEDERRPGFVDGVDLLRGDAGSWLRLLSVRRHQSHLFLRYGSAPGGP
ncbi:MAG TPA: dihydrofolate reductase family protein [Candidatus Dormibacteraeota bacterium]